ncbi:Peptide chain release factor 2 [Candidatus Vidania fulgoroideae]|nr:Peptide chain release factor 2 [Candidatus Vidania fulgoroideae]
MTFFFEIKAGPGGKDSKNCTYILYKQYKNFFLNRKLIFETIEIKKTGKNQVNYVLFEVKNKEGIEKYLKNEVGVHKIIRNSKFKKKENIQTSLCYINFIPKIEKEEIKIIKKEIKIDTFKSRGPGGQSVNKTNSAVRITHIPTGITAECQKERSQHINIKIAKKKIIFKISKTQDNKKGIGNINWSKSVRIYFLDKSLIVDNIYKKKTNKVKEFLNGNLDIIINENNRFRKSKKKRNK